MSLRAKRESIFKSTVPAGAYLFTISNVKTFRKSNGDPILNEGNPGLVMTLSCDAGEHQELYWIEGFNYSKLLRILSHIKVDIEQDIKKKDMLGKQFWGLVIEYKTMRGVEEIKSEKKLVETSENFDFRKQDFIVYKEDSFNIEDPAF